MTRIDLGSKRFWSELELKRLTSANQLVFQGRLLALDLWTNVQERVVLQGISAYLKLSTGRTTRLLSDCEWVGPGWCLIDRTLFRISEEAMEFVQPQPVSEANEKRWRRDWQVEGSYQPPRQPVLELLHARGHVARGWLEQQAGRSPLVGSAEESDLMAAGFERRGMQGDYGCEPEQVAEGLDLLLCGGWKLIWKGLPIVAQTESRLEVRAAGRLQGEIQFGVHSVAVDEAWRHPEATLCALPGGWGLLATHSLRRWVCFDGEGVKIPAGLASDEALAGCAVHESARAWMARDLPDNPHPLFQGSLRGYQREGMRWILSLHARRGGGLLADQMGLGKTIQVLAALSHLSGHVLLVVPTSLLENWKREWQRFLPHRTLRVHHGTTRWRNLQELRDHLRPDECLITTPGVVQQDSWMQQGEWEAVIVDEAQQLKNLDAATTQAVHRLNGQLRLALTGTPLENRPDELWTHLRFLDSELAGERVGFTRLFSHAKGRQALKTTWRGWMLRRCKAEVLAELPPLVEQEVLLDCHPDQWAAYERMKRSGELGSEPAEEDESQRGAPPMLVKLMRLRQISCAPMLCGLDAPSPKLDQLAADLVESVENGQQVLVFSQFAQLLTLAAQRCPVPHGVLTGKTRQRQAVVDDFQEGRTPVLFCSLKAAGVGLNLQRADLVILLDPWWNRAAEQQAIDRAHRLGREGSVLVKRYLMAGTVEEKVAQLQRLKQDWTDAWWDEDGQWIGRAEDSTGSWESLLADVDV
jgi:superfamily II DNA or RNA helicase